MTTLEEIELAIEEKGQLEKEIEEFKKGIESNEEDLKNLIEHLHYLFGKHAQEIQQ